MANINITDTNMTAKSDQNPVHFHTGEKVIMSAILIMISLTGTVGNVMTCVIFIKSKKLRSTTNYLIVSLAVADVLQSLNMIFIILSLVSDGWILGDAVCQFTGWANMNFVIISMVSIALIGVNRYFKVVRTTGKSLFTAKFTIITIACTWIFPSFLSLGPIFGWSVYQYRPQKLMCFWRFSDSVSFAMITTYLAVIFPFATICFTTYKIIKHVKRSSTRVANSKLTMPLRLRRKHENRISTMLLSVTFCFLIFYAPSTTVNMLQVAYGKNYSLPYRTDSWTVVVALFSHAINPVIYCILNKNFRKGLKGICSKEKQGEIQLFREITVFSELSGSRGMFARELRLLNREAATEQSGSKGISAKDKQRINRQVTFFSHAASVTVEIPTCSSCCLEKD